MQRCATQVAEALHSKMVEVTPMDRDQNQKYYSDRKTDENPGSRNATAPNGPSHHAPGGGISNRPDAEERENQDRLPPRGQEKAGD
jgi:hypothetical protein